MPTVLIYALSKQEESAHLSIGEILAGEPIDGSRGTSRVIRVSESRLADCWSRQMDLDLRLVARGGNGVVERAD